MPGQESISIFSLLTNLGSGLLGAVVGGIIQARATKKSTETQIAALRSSYEKEREDRFIDFRKALSSELERHRNVLVKKFSDVMLASSEINTKVISAIFPISEPPIFGQYEYISKLQPEEKSLIEEYRGKIENINSVGEIIITKSIKDNLDIDKTFEECVRQLFETSHKLTKILNFP